MRENESADDRHRPLIERNAATLMGGAQPRRSAQRHAAYLLPYLKPGMRVLDAGCGPAAITRGLARHVAPGVVVGLDRVFDRSVELASKDDGVRYVQGDVRALPFADGSFDAVHSHAMFQHLPEAVAALSELRRVLVPGGVIGVADWDRDLCFIHPAPAELVRSLAWVTKLREDEGGNPRAGRELASVLTSAGFEDAAMHVVANGFTRGSSAKSVAEQWARYFEDPENGARIRGLGLAVDDELRAVAAQWRGWGREPGAILIAHWFCAVAFRGRT